MRRLLWLIRSVSLFAVLWVIQGVAWLLRTRDGDGK